MKSYLEIDEVDFQPLDHVNILMNMEVMVEEDDDEDDEDL
jgi:hypothetical protein